MNIVKFPQSNLKDISGSLRTLADLIDGGREPEGEQCLVVITHEMGVNVYGYGGLFDLADSIGILELGKAELIRCFYSDD